MWHFLSKWWRLILYLYVFVSSCSEKSCLSHYSTGILKTAEFNPFCICNAELQWGFLTLEASLSNTAELYRKWVVFKWLMDCVACSVSGISITFPCPNRKGLWPWFIKRASALPLLFVCVIFLEIIINLIISAQCGYEIYIHLTSI